MALKLETKPASKQQCASIESARSNDAFIRKLPFLSKKLDGKKLSALATVRGRSASIIRMPSKSKEAKQERKQLSNYLSSEVGEPFAQAIVSTVHGEAAKTDAIVAFVQRQIKILEEIRDQKIGLFKDLASRNSLRRIKTNALSTAGALGVTGAMVLTMLKDFVKEIANGPTHWSAIAIPAAIGIGAVAWFVTGWALDAIVVWRTNFLMGRTEEKIGKLLRQQQEAIDRGVDYVCEIAVALLETISGRR